MSFNVTVDINPEDSDILRSLLAAAGLSDFLEASVSELTSQVQSLVSLNITRTDLTNGDTEDLGNFPPGSITDDGFTTFSNCTLSW